MNYRQLAATLMNELAKNPKLGDLKVNICVGKDDYREIDRLESVYRFSFKNGKIEAKGTELAFYPEGISG